MSRLCLLVALCAGLHPAAALAMKSSAGRSTGEGQAARNFYVSPDGSDSAAGTSAAVPWRTLSRVDSAALAPGDHIHLEGGASFDQPLAPFAGTAGTAEAPIVFDSYGAGRAHLNAGIYLNSVADLDFEHLDVTSRGKGVFSSARGTGAQEITLRDITIANVPLAGISSNQRADTSWLIDRVTVSDTGDSGIYFVGSHFMITKSTITDTGTNSSIGYPRHGIYAAGPSATVINNTISGSSTSGISLRYENNVVEGNRISGGSRGVSFEEQSGIAGTTRILFNTIANVSDSGVVVARPARESFLIANNTIDGAGSYGLYFQRVPKLTIANNIVQTAASTAGLLSIRAPTARYSEHHNLWYGKNDSAFYWNGAAASFPAYQSASGEGRDDASGDPKLGPNFGLPTDSPALEAGTIAVDPSLHYQRLCDGAPFDYCGVAPDLGSHERMTTRRR